VSEAGLSVGDTAWRASSEFGRRLPWLAVLSALSYAVPNVLDRAFRVVRFRGAMADALVVASLAAVWALALASATSLALSSARGERRAFRSAVTRAARRLPAAAAAALLAALAVGAGLAILLAPGLLALASFASAPAVAVDEGCGPARALARSVETSRGSRARILAVLAILTVAASLALAAIMITLLAAGAASDVGLFATWTSVVALSTLPAIGAAMAHVRLRELKQGPRNEELERVFG
jgi:hypothetical protein